ncbi:hypothetical protein PACTADRAFT_20878, partial [Pachysolen tannophilus NRRL Y-2460]
ELNLFDNIDISKLSVLLMPENYPSKIAESSPLAELYYLTQTCPLSKLLPGTNKTLTTDTYESALLEGKVAVVYSRIEELKRQKKWSLRQPGRFVDPFTAENGPSSSHWNSLLTEMKWMSVDFAEARKFKLVQCFYIAQSVMDYWNYDKSFQPFKIYVDSEDLTNTDAAIIENLPTYIAFDDFKEEKAIDPYLKNPITAVSRLLTPIDEDDEEWYKVVMRNDDSVTSPLASTYQKGFFGLNGQKRLNFIKPPLPPSLKYLDLRTPTIWLPEDDRYLIHYIAEYQFNWNIVSAHLSAHPTRGYSSNIERRTPWQCFERYIQLNDKFQFSDMRGGYSSLAQQWLEAAHKAQATTKRRISPLGVGSDSIQRGHKRLRWASMFDAIRKCMRKRENAPKPSNSPHKKFNDEKKGNVPTPAELSKLKFDRDKAIQEAYMHQSNANGMISNTNAPGIRNGNVITKPTTPNGTPYTNEQIQHLLQLQRQRKLMQQNSASASPAVVTNTAAPLRKLNLSNFSNAHVSAIINQIQLQNPKMSKADVTKLAANYLHNLTQQ